MRIFLPNSAHLANIGGFLRKCDFGGPEHLEVGLHPKWVSVHPFALALTAAVAAEVRRSGGTVTVKVPNKKYNALNYLVRMRLFEFLGHDPEHDISGHESSGRFIPLTQVRTNSDLSNFVVEIVPLLHASKREVEPVQYVVSELVRNVLEHSASHVGAVVCAQYYAKQQRLALAVADAGRGVRDSLQPMHPVTSDLGALLLALRPGITGTTKRIGGTDYNAGAGLFFTKSIACASNNLFAIYSGQGMFKLLRTPKSRAQILIQSNPALDYARRENDMPSYGGTVVGIDISLSDAAKTLAELVDAVRQVYNIDIKAKAKARFKKPRFV